jgi:hypothetical protein
VVDPYYPARISELLLIDTGAQILKVLDLGVLAVGHLREEDGVESLRVEILLVGRVLEIVVAWAWVLFAREIVFSRLVRLENLSLNLA